uniref:Immunoglobulin domain-containing protein n=1 Tax=Pygocentrus nattereri TaxID=42514 RepID=A0AAR2K1J2_PYGNA
MRCFCVVIWILLSEVAAEAPDIRVAGHVGGSVKIQCPHLLAKTNTKYFCRYPCIKNQDMLIKSGQSLTGRYTLEDSGNGDITVTIIDLQKSDAGTYWCGVERLLMMDTYHEVLLTVTDAPSTHKHPPKATPTAAAVRTVRFKFFTTSSSTLPPSITHHPPSPPPLHLNQHFQLSTHSTSHHLPERFYCMLLLDLSL